MGPFYGSLVKFDHRASVEKRNGFTFFNDKSILLKLIKHAVQRRSADIQHIGKIVCADGEGKAVLRTLRAEEICQLSLGRSCGKAGDPRVEEADLIGKTANVVEGKGLILVDQGKNVIFLNKENLAGPLRSNDADKAMTGGKQGGNAENVALLKGTKQNAVRTVHRVCNCCARYQYTKIFAI